MSGTPEQVRAIEAVGADVCVVAGAGTGKTFVLTERLVKRVQRDGVALREVLAITFTEKAAAEMKERLAAALERAGRRGARQEVDAAAISTVHAFCARLLREHAVAAGVDPSFAVLDEVASERLRREALDRLVDELRDADASAFATLATLGGDDPGETLLDVYREAQASGRPVGGFVRETPGLPALADAVARVRRAVADADAAAGGATDAARRAVARVADAARALPEDDAPVDDVARAVASVADAVELRCRGAVKEALEAVRAECAEALAVAAEHALAPLRDVVARALERLDVLYDEAKGRGARLDFADLERAAVALLERRADVRAEVRARRPEVLVDEFQDTNPVQARLVELLATPGRLFVVGDPKQAIYGFRGADVGVFDERLRAVDAEGRGGVVALRTSFRSRPEVLGFVNRLFAGGVGGTTGTAGDVRLLAGRAWAPATAPAVEVYAVAGERMHEARGAEAAWIADRVAALCDGGLRVAAPTPDDPLATRAAEFGDVAVLLRATTHVKALEQAFVLRDVPYLVVKGRGFFRAREVVDVAHLLACVDNPRDDLALACVLRSPACRASLDALHVLGAARARGDALADVLFAWEGGAAALPDLPEDDAPALRRLASTLRDLRARRAADGVTALVDRAYAATRVDVLALGRPNGRQRAANLRKVRSLARAADAAGLSLRDFVAELKLLREREVREAEAAVSGGARGAVSVMTVHAAKGLEFPVVFVPDVGRAETARGGEVVADVRGGVGFRARGEGAGDARPWLHARLTERRRAAEQAESERLLYVAATRAADHLVLTAALTDGGEGAARRRVWWGRVAEAVGLDGPADADRDVDAGPAAGPGDGATRTVVRVHAPRAADAAANGARARTLLGGAAAELAAGIVPPRPLHADAAAEAARLLAEASRRAPAPDGTPYATNVSALTAFARCPQEYRLRHVVGVPEDAAAAWGGARTAFDVDEEQAPGDDGAGDDEDAGEAAAEPASARAVGRAAHAALERLAPAFRDDVRAVVEDALRAETAGAAPDPRQIAQVAGWIEAFRDAPLGAELRRADRADVRREQAFLLRAGGTVVRGQVDLMWRGPDGWSVLDFKTAAIGTPAAEHALQMRLYALGVRAAAGALPSRLALWSLPLARAVDVPCTPADEAAVAALLAEFGDRTRASDLRPRARPPCGTCRVRAACGFAAAGAAGTSAHAP